MWDVVDNIFQPRKMEQRFLDCLGMKIKQQEAKYEKVYSCRSLKEMWDILALAYEGTSQVKDSKVSMLIHQQELLKMEDHESIDQMFGKFQTIISNLRSLGKTYDNYDHITKIL
ncbi:hypothetical protein CR513_16350, partial [Mucuna pruriens]